MYKLFHDFFHTFYFLYLPHSQFSSSFLLLFLSPLSVFYCCLFQSLAVLLPSTYVKGYDLNEHFDRTQTKIIARLMHALSARIAAVHKCCGSGKSMCVKRLIVFIYLFIFGNYFVRQSNSHTLVCVLS
jgi:hypothetical protein